MDEKLTAEILATYNSIGYSDDDKYYKNSNCLECVKALVMYMRRDDDNHSIRRLLGQAQVVQRDLLPILKYYKDEQELYDVVLRLLLNLTSPAIVVYEEDIPQNKRYRNFYNQIEEHVRSYKSAFVDKLLWDSLTDRLRSIIKLEESDIAMADRTTVERILMIIRNILKVAADPAEEKRSDDDMTIHDRVIMFMHTSGIEEVLLAMTSSDSWEGFYLHVLEIISLILREQTGEQLAKTTLTRNEEDKVKDEKELIEIREKELIQTVTHMKKFSTRHSRFGGTFVVRGLEGPSGKGLLCHKPINSVADLCLDSTKKRKRTANNRLTMAEENPTRRSTNSCRLILKDFCSEFLYTSYNTVMRLVKSDIDRGRSQEHDETYYLWSLRFFMEFNRYINPTFRLQNVSETMSTSVFHYIQTLLDNYHGMMVTDKENIPTWSRRAHSAIQAYKELLFTAVWMDKCGDESVKESSRAIKRTVFYLPEYRELCFGLLTNCDPVKLSKLYLKDVIETNHLFLKMLEEFSTSSNERIMVKTKGKKRKKTKHGKKAKKPRRGSTKSSSELEEAWNGVSGQISSALLSSELPDEAAAGAAANGYVNVIPFDAASDVPIDEQKTTAVERIAIFLHTGKHAAAITLLRAAREVWPDSPEEFGEPADPDEISVLKTIFVDQGNHTAVKGAVEAATSNNNEDEENEENPGDEEQNENSGTEGDNEEDEQEAVVSHKEEEFDFKGFLHKYANAKIVCNYARLFADWNTLDPLTLHCVMKMFHRFVFQLGYPALICQASIFRTFQKIMEIADYRKDLKDIAKFFYHFWPKFVQICETNKHMFMELLFWKTASEALEIQEGYGTINDNKTKAKAPRAKKAPKGQKRNRKQMEEDRRALASDSDDSQPNNGNASNSENLEPKKVAKKQKQKRTRKPKEVSEATLEEDKRLLATDSDSSEPTANVNVSDSENSQPGANGNNSDSNDESEVANQTRHQKQTKENKRVLASDSDDSEPTAIGNASNSVNSQSSANGNTLDSDNESEISKSQKRNRKQMEEDKRLLATDSDDSEPTASGNASNTVTSQPGATGSTVDSDDESEVGLTSQKINPKQKKQDKRVLQSDSDDSEPTADRDASNSVTSQPGPTGNTVDSDDESEVGLTSRKISPKQTKKDKRVLESDSEDSESTTSGNASISRNSQPVATGNTLVSDDESEVGATSQKINPKRKRARIIVDSSDED